MEVLLWQGLMVCSKDKFVVRVSDGSSTDEITFRVKVEPINDDAPVITTASSINHAENEVLLR